MYWKLLGLFFSRFPVSYKAVAQALLPSFKSVTLYSLLLSLLRSQKHFNTMYDMTKPQHIITVASELKSCLTLLLCLRSALLQTYIVQKVLETGFFCQPVCLLQALPQAVRPPEQRSIYKTHSCLPEEAVHIHIPMHPLQKQSDVPPSRSMEFLAYI